MADYTALTDHELVRRLRVRSSLTPLEVELVARLERALDEIDDLEQEIKRGDDAGGSREGGREAVFERQGNLVLLPRQ